MCPVLYLVYTDDWEVLYGENGKMIYQGHDIPAEIWFKTGQENPYAKLQRIWMDLDEVEERFNCNFPVNLYEIPEEILNRRN